MDNCFLVNNTVYILTISYIWQVPHKWIYGLCGAQRKTEILKALKSKELKVLLNLSVKVSPQLQDQ